jgi:hypothetical protein
MRLLISLAGDSFTVEDITERMNVEEDFKPRRRPFTARGVELKLQKMGLPRANAMMLNRPWAQEQNEWLVAMVCEKPPGEPAMSDGEIAEFLEAKFGIPLEASWVRDQINELKKIEELQAVGLK